MPEPMPRDPLAHHLFTMACNNAPQLDEFYCGGDAGSRADELAALGLSEAAIWAAGEPTARG